MTRFLSTSQQAYSEREGFMLRQLVDLGVTSGTVYACNGYRYLYALGNTYTPVGYLGGIDPIREESDPFPRGLSMWLSAVNSSQLYEPLREDMFNRDVRVYEVFLDPETYAMSNTPELRWSGKINQLELRFNDPERGNYYQTEAETQLRRMPARAYFNKETLQATYSGDTFFDLQPQIPTYRASWGNQASQGYIGPGGGGGHWVHRGQHGRQWVSDQG